MVEVVQIYERVISYLQSPELWAKFTPLSLESIILLSPFRGACSVFLL